MFTKEPVMKSRENVILTKSLEFAIGIDSYCKTLKTCRNYELANQLFRSGTSLGANVWEAQEAESRNDFIHKFKVAAKEGKETEFWLKLCSKKEDVPTPDELLNQLDEINRIIRAVVYSSRLKKQ